MESTLINVILKISKWLPRGYGFAENLDAPMEDIFVHAADLPPGHKSLNPGDLISCKLERNHKGLRARHVALVRIAHGPAEQPQPHPRPD